MNVNISTLNTPYIISQSCVLSNIEYTALSFGRDHHISTKSKDVAIEVEFEQFYQGLLKNLTHMLDNKLTSLKTKL